MITKERANELSEKILRGVQLAIERLVKERQLTDDYLVISENGKVVKIKAREIKK
jgi:hypothetical protein